VRPWGTPSEYLWGAVTFALAILLAFLLIMIAQGEPLVPAQAGQSPYEERLLQLDREAIERAYVEHIKKLFSIWTVDYSEEPPKAVKGAQQGRSAYARAIAAIEKRERELQRDEIVPLPPRKPADGIK
jgi:hypothetical protein